MRIISELKKLDNPDRLFWWSVGIVMIFRRCWPYALVLAVVIAVHTYMVY